jgi:hypothetical protein
MDLGQHMTKTPGPDGVAGGSNGLWDHEVMPFTSALLIRRLQMGSWTASAWPGDLNSDSECLTQDFNMLWARRWWLNPVLDSSGFTTIDVEDSEVGEREHRGLYPEWSDKG